VDKGGELIFEFTDVYTVLADGLPDTERHWLETYLMPMIWQQYVWAGHKQQTLLFAVDNQPYFYMGE